MTPGGMVELDVGAEVELRLVESPMHPRMLVELDAGTEIEMTMAKCRCPAISLRDHRTRRAQYVQRKSRGEYRPNYMRLGKSRYI